MKTKTIFAALFVGALAVSAWSQGNLDALDPKDRALVDEACTKCHDAGKFSSLKFTPEEWDAVLKKMQINGAKFNYDEMKAVKWSR